MKTVIFQMSVSLDGYFEGPIASAFLDQGLIDEVRVILTPIVLGAGKAVFGDIKKRHPLKLVSTKVFESGNLLATYKPA